MQALRAPVAQLDRAIASGAIGREFESLRARHQINLADLAIKVEYIQNQQPINDEDSN